MQEIKTQDRDETQYEKTTGARTDKSIVKSDNQTNQKPIYQLGLGGMCFMNLLSEIFLCLRIYSYKD